MKDRLPTDFETKVLKRIDNGRGLLAGDGQVAISAACRRLEKLGYAAHPGTRWYVTTKGDEYLASIKAAEQKHGADSSICSGCGHIDGYHPEWCMAGE